MATQQSGEPRAEATPADLEDCRRHRKNLQWLVDEVTAERNALRERVTKQEAAIMEQLDREIAKNGEIARLRAACLGALTRFEQDGWPLNEANTAAIEMLRAALSGS